MGTWGGKRANAGRKPADGVTGDLIAMRVSIPQEYVDKIEEMGAPNFSVAVRKIIMDYFAARDLGIAPGGLKLLTKANSTNVNDIGARTVGVAPNKKSIFKFTDDRGRTHTIIIGGPPTYEDMPVRLPGGGGTYNMSARLNLLEAAQKKYKEIEAVKNRLNNRLKKVN